MARLVNEDMSWRGVDMKADDWILLSFPAANRDPAQFDRADEVVIDREVNRHAAFGLGIHRCLGSHLARMELRVALETWLDRIPEFSLADPAAVTWAAGQVRGPAHAAAALRRPGRTVTPGHPGQDVSPPGKSHVALQVRSRGSAPGRGGAARLQVSELHRRTPGPVPRRRHHNAPQDI